MLRLFVNLDRSTDRLADVQRQLGELNLNFERVSAVDGSLLTEEECKKITYPNNHFSTKVRFTRDLTRGEIGCFLSHRKCWRRLLDSQENWALILEDDIKILPRAKAYFETETWIPNGVDCIQLSGFEIPTKGLINPSNTISLESDYLVDQVTPFALGTYAYLISRRAAELALSLSEKLPAPVDNFLFSPWFDLYYQMKLRRLYPSIVVPGDFMSEIGTRVKKQVKKAPFWIRHCPTRFLMDRRIKSRKKGSEEFEFSCR